MMPQDDLFGSGSPQPFVFDGSPTGTPPAPASSPDRDSDPCPEPRDTMCARAATLLRSRPNEWLDGRLFADICGLYGWRTRLSELRRAPWSMDIENRQRREGRYTVSEYRWNSNSEAQS
jgi:hypothetical protein